MLKQQFNIHPIACVFPMMSSDEFEHLKQDIKDNGQHESIVFWNELLIDGRNRLKACEELGVEPETCELPIEEDPITYVLGANLHRRQLHPSQRAMIAAKMATMKRGDVGNGRKVGPPNGGSTVDDAAALLSIKPRSVDRAKHVLENGSAELITAVEQCEISVSLAEKLCKACGSKREQTKLLKDGKDAIREFVNPTPNDPKPPRDEADSEFGDEYEYNIVKLFKHADYRLNTLKLLIKDLEDGEREVVKEWLTTPTPN